MLKKKLIKRFGLFVFFIVCFSLSPSVEAATLTVDTTTDNASLTNCNAGTPNDCSLRGAIINANTNSGADTIIIPAGTYLLTIAGSAEDSANMGDLDISSNTTLQGNGSDLTIIDANGLSRVFDLLIPVSGTSTIAINNLTIRDGANNDTGIHAGGGGIAIRSVAGVSGSVNLTMNEAVITNNFTSTASGGGISVLKPVTASNSILTINHSTISNNSTTGVTIGAGGGINCNGCTLNLNNSLVLGNQVASTGDVNNVGGGGIFVGGNSAIVTIHNSTLSGNRVNSSGGGLLLGIGTGSVTLNHTTVTNNVADDDNTGLGNGGGLYNNSGTMSVQNSIVAGNDDESTPANDDCGNTTGFSITSTGYNVLGNGTGCTPIVTDSTAAANLVALADNGGATQTHAISAGSAAIDRVPNGTNGCDANSDIDQRGAIRADGAGGGSACDSGAYESDSSPLFQYCGLTTGINYVFQSNVQIFVNTLGTLGCINVVQINSNHPNATTALQTGRYWTINASGATGFNVNLTFPDSVTTPKACRYPGGLGGYGWDCTGTHQDNGGSVTRFNVTQFSDWAVGENPGPTSVRLNELGVKISSVWVIVPAFLGLCLISFWLISRRSRSF